jgi:hypothetical protein
VKISITEGFIIKFKEYKVTIYDNRVDEAWKYDPEAQKQIMVPAGEVLLAMARELDNEDNRVVQTRHL